MTFDQGLLLALLGGMLAVFVLDRWRIETVALAGLGLACVSGLVPAGAALAGFAHPAVITVIAVLLIVEALHGSQIIIRFGQWLSGLGLRPTGLLACLCITGAVLSTVMNNIGAMALLLPVLFSLSQTGGYDSRAMLMPLAFATLLGGVCTLTGTPANLIVSNTLRDAAGQGLPFLSLFPAGAVIAAAGLAVILFWCPRIFPLVPAGAAGDGPEDDLFDVRELAVTQGGETLEGLAARLQGRIISVIRQEAHVFPLRPQTELLPGDIVFAEARARHFTPLIAEGRLAPAVKPEPGDALTRLAVMPHSSLAGSRIAAIADLEELDLRPAAVTTHGRRHEGRMADLQLLTGDVLTLCGAAGAARQLAEDHGLIVVEAESATTQEAVPQASPVPLVLFVAGLVVAATGYVTPEAALGGTVLVLALLGHLDLRVALKSLNWPVILLLAAMLPLGGAMETTGTAAMLAEALAAHLVPGQLLPAAIAMLVIALVMTPLVNNAATAAILAPVALQTAASLGLPPAPLLAAVAFGASLDFLTPVGHHNNTLAYGLGGYRFADFLKAGWPVTLAACAGAIAGLALFWT
ncbi:SLC13 family permease [Pannonibacter indicus]|uniref:SLC13 family permease n=1 Tax=Pannonibacter indicus TaxID=466044 RepID=UPI00391D7434